MQPKSRLGPQLPSQAGDASKKNGVGGGRGGGGEGEGDGLSHDMMRKEEGENENENESESESESENLHDPDVGGLSHGIGPGSSGVSSGVSSTSTSGTVTPHSSLSASGMASASSHADNRSHTPSSTSMHAHSCGGPSENEYYGASGHRYDMDPSLINMGMPLSDGAVERKMNMNMSMQVAAAGNGNGNGNGDDNDNDREGWKGIMSAVTGGKNSGTSPNTTTNASTSASVSVSTSRRASHSRRVHGPSTSPHHPHHALDPSERRTVFIPNLPKDATERELNLLFAFAEGFVKVQLYHHREVGDASSRDPSHTNYGCFALFETSQHAVAARDRLHGFVFDANTQPPTILQARIALKNLWQTREEMNQYFIKKAATSNNNSRRGSLTQMQNPNHPFSSPIIPFEFTPFPPALLPHHHGTTAGDSSGAGMAGMTGMVTPPHPFQQTVSPLSYPNSAYGSPVMGPSAGMPFNTMTGGIQIPTQSLGPPAQHQTAAFFNEIDAAHSHAQTHTLLSPQHQHQQHMTGGILAAMQTSYADTSDGNEQTEMTATDTGNGYHHSTHHPPPYPSHRRRTDAGPYNPPCTTLFLARLDRMSDDYLASLLHNSFPDSLKDYKFQLDSKGQKIAFVEFNTIDDAYMAMTRINGFEGITCAFSKNPLNRRM